MSVEQKTRLHGLDALRGGALLLGIVFHAAFSFFPGDQLWLIMDVQRSASLSGLAYVLHIFRMTVFFLLAGYFGRMQTYRLGTRPFAVDRLKRIWVPLLVFWPIMMVCFIALAIWGLAVANGGTIPDLSVHISGSGDVDIRAAVGDAYIRASGSSDVYVKSISGSVDSSVSGSADFNRGDD